MKKGKNSWTLICTECPNGCSLEVSWDGHQYNVNGNRCNKGIQYAINEVTNPKRPLATTVKTVFKDFPRLTVKTDKEIPLKNIFLFMNVINKIIVKKRLKPGNIVKRNILKSKINLVSADDMTCKES